MPGDERRAAGTNLGLVVVAMPLTGVTGSALARSSWVSRPLGDDLTSGELGPTKLRIVAVGLDAEHYGVLVGDGWETFFSMVLSRLRDVRQEPRE